MCTGVARLAAMALLVRVVSQLDPAAVTDTGSPTNESLLVICSRSYCEALVDQKTLSGCSGELTGQLRRLGNAEIAGRSWMRQVLPD